MATTYKFAISLPVTDLLPRNRVVNVIHLQHVVGSQGDGELENMCSDIADMYQKRYHNTGSEVMVKAYDVDATPNYPRASVVVDAGTPWTTNVCREIALCLSFAGDYAGNKSERGRIFLAPFLDPLSGGMAVRPSNAALNWALDFYRVPNESFPDLGGIDWKFGVYSRKNESFKQTTQAWVNDDWDIQRRRGLRENSRVSVTREG